MGIQNVQNRSPSMTIESPLTLVDDHGYRGHTHVWPRISAHKRLLADLQWFFDNECRIPRDLLEKARPFECAIFEHKESSLYSIDKMGDSTQPGRWFTLQMRSVEDDSWLCLSQPSGFNYYDCIGHVRSFRWISTPDSMFYATQR